MHLREPTERVAHDREGRATRTTRRTSRSRSAAACPRRSFQLDDDTNGTLSNTRTYTNVPVGTYSVSETVPAGWDQTSATCNDGSPVSAINIGAGENVTCTFTNQKRGQHRGGARHPAERRPGLLVHGRRRALAHQLPARRRLRPGAAEHALVQRPAGRPAAIRSARPACRPAGRSASATCDDGSPVSNINVAPGEVVTCTFTNQKRGEIVIVKDATPDDPQDFSFTAGGGLAPASFSLDDDADGTLSNTRTFSNVAPGSGYSVSETVPSGWDQTSATCNDGSPVSNINVAPGRGRHVHVLEPQAGPDRGREGRHSGRPAGLLLHRRRRPVARPASSSTTTPTRRSRTPAPSRRRAGRRLLDRRDRPERLGPDRARPATTAARSRTSTSRPARPSPARSRTASARSSWS